MQSGDGTPMQELVYKRNRELDALLKSKTEKNKKLFEDENVYKKLRYRTVPQQVLAEKNKQLNKLIARQVKRNKPIILSDEKSCTQALA